MVRLLQVARLDGTVFIIMELCDSSLLDVLQAMGERGQRPSEENVRWVMARLLRALAFMHSRGVLHRDIKSDNILLQAGDSSGGLTGKTAVGSKLADFGQATSTAAVPKGKGLTPYVGTRWYRAPELLLAPHVRAGSRSAFSYGPGIDVWSAGCVMAELLAGRTLFQGTSAADQLNRYAHVLGPPAESWPASSRLAEACGLALPRIKGVGLAAVLSKAGVRVSAQAAAACEALLTWDPARRPSAADALRLDFFRGGAGDPLVLWPRS